MFLLDSHEGYLIEIERAALVGVRGAAIDIEDIEY